MEGYRSPEVSLANIPALSVWQGATDRWSKFAAVSAVGVDIWLCGSSESRSRIECYLLTDSQYSSACGGPKRDFSTCTKV